MLRSQSNLKYPITTHVVKAALSFTHKSSDVERRFSESGKILTADKTKMNGKTFNTRFSIIDGLKRFNSIPHEIPISGELLKLARTARHSYHIVIWNKEIDLTCKKSVFGLTSILM